MIKWKTSINHGVLCAWCLGAMISSLSATVVFEEDWNTGLIDENSWTIADGSRGGCELVSLGEGDYALSIKEYNDEYTVTGGNWVLWGTGIMTKKSFPRGGNLRISYKVWSDKPQPSSSLVGPWHHEMFELPSFFTLEAGLTYGFQNWCFEENRNYRQRSLPDNDSFTTSLSKAISKETALTMMVTLGDKTGAAFEWNDGSGFKTSIDTKGMPLPKNPYERNNIGWSPRARIGFAPYMSWMLDDLVVQSDLTEHGYQALEASVPHRTIKRTKYDKKPWTHLNYRNDPDHFQFVITADLTGGYRKGAFGKGAFEDAVEKINLLQPEFVITIGDLVQGYTAIESVLETEFNELDRRLAPLEMPFFYVPGNHDTSNEVQLRLWRERYGNDYYHFVYKDVLFLCLNTTNGREHYTICDEQIDWLAGVLEDNKDVRWTMVLMHDPIWLYDWKTGWCDVEDMLLDRPYTVYAGHYHYYAKMKRRDRDYFILSVTGGWLGTDTIPEKHLGPFDHYQDLPPEESGRFDHIMWVTMSDKGPMMANLALQGIYDDAVRTEETARKQLEERTAEFEKSAKIFGVWSK